MSSPVTLALATPSSRVVSSSGTATLTASSGGRSRSSTSRARSSTPGSGPARQPDRHRAVPYVVGEHDQVAGRKDFPVRQLPGQRFSMRDADGGHWASSQER